MGLSIGALKIMQRSNDERFLDSPNHLFSPIKHLSAFNEGSYKVKVIGDTYDRSYSTYNRFRKVICNTMLGVEPKEVWANINSFIEMPFIEMIHFSDCEYCFDYYIAEKLYNDFKQHRDMFLDVEKDFDFYKQYDCYTKILHNCVKHKGVVYYG